MTNGPAAMANWMTGDGSIPQSVFAWSMASRRLPAPESAVLSTV